ncbi:four helix bundle protein [bacterium]|nr:four helix bundle protein [bacterium]
MKIAQNLKIKMQSYNVKSKINKSQKLFKMQNNNQKFKSEFKKRLYKFVLRLLKFVSSLPRNPITKVISHQLIKSGTSILSNYIEGCSSSSKKEFTNFFQICLKSANESKVWLALLKDTRNGDKREIKYLLKELDEISKIFASSILSLKGKKQF